MSAPSPGLLGRIFSLDHKVIARQFLWLGLGFLLFGGLLALAIRWQLAYPGRPLPLLGKLLFPTNGGAVTPNAYSTLFTMHGTIMIFWAITPIVIGAFGNLLIPLQIGARDMAFPVLNMLSFWTTLASSVTLLAGFFVPAGAAATGWTAYPPLSTNVGQPGPGMTLWVLSVFLIGAGSVMGAINYITTVVRERAPGMSFFRLPLTVWGLLLTAVLNALFVPVLGAAMILLFLDRVFGTQFFVAGLAAARTGGDPVLYQHLFWIFGHPEVYILILPVWGYVSDVLSFFSRKPAFGYRATALSMVAITVLSMVVYGHHMFVTGMSPLLGQGFMMLTMIISIPSAIFFLNWLLTLWKGAIQLTTPMLFALGVVFVFALGGLTGLYLAAISTDIVLHDTYFVVGHFHLTMAAAVLLGALMAIYFWFPKLFGRMLSERLGKLHFWLTFLPLTFVFVGQLLIGYAGMQRRLYDPNVYEFLRHLQPVQKGISHTAFLLGAAQLIFVYNFFRSLLRGAKAEANPWKVGTLEWTVPSPPPPHNFDRIPVVQQGPHELGHPDLGERDWIAQDEPWPERPASARPLSGMAAALLLLFVTALGGCSEPQFTRPMKLGGKTVMPEVLNRGKDAYGIYCRACHGDKGDGKGPAGVGLLPPARDFTLGRFKFAAVPSGQLPHDEDLVRVVKRGLNGTAMLPWHIPDQDLDAIVQYIKTFSKRWQTEEPGEKVVPEPDPWRSDPAGAVARGRKLYHAFECWSCHPAYGTRQEVYDWIYEIRQSASADFRDEMYRSSAKETEYGHPILPPDFLRSDIRAGTTLEDLYRTIASGIGGTAMPQWKGSIPDRDIWAIVHYVKSLIDMKGKPEARALRARLFAPQPRVVVKTPPPARDAGPADGGTADGGAADGGADAAVSPVRAKGGKP